MAADLKKPNRPEREPSDQKEEGRLLEAVVRENILCDLGRPAGLFRVQVTRVFEDHYRANVFIGPDAVSAKVVHSYFLKADSDGKILTSSPAIIRLH